MKDGTSAGSKSAFHEFSRSGRLTPVLVATLCLLLLLASVERGRGHYHRIENAIDKPLPPPPSTQGPGGFGPIALKRSASTIGAQPEFLSMMLLPGRGMEMLQLTATIPGHGEVPLLMAPSISDATDQMTGMNDDVNGALGTTFGGAILAPWAGRITGAPVAGDASLVQANWQGHTLKLPAGTTAGTSVQGLLLKRVPDSVKSEVLADGQTVEAVFHMDETKQGWPTTFDVTVKADLTAQAVTLTVTTTNTGQQPMPVGTGWMPYFSIPSGDRANALLAIPSSTLEETNKRTGMPAGTLSLADSTPNDFILPGGTKLAHKAVEATYVNLQSAAFGEGPKAMLRDPDYNFALRVIPQTPNITSLRVIAPADKPWVLIAPNSNLDDPLGPQWTQNSSGIAVLSPGQTFKWQVRLEISQD